MNKHQLSPETQAILDGIFAKNQALYGGFRMEADGSGDGGGDGGGDDANGDGKGGESGSDSGKDGDEPKPSETLDYWKKRSRENERRAKANAKDAEELQKLRDAQKTEEQKQQDAQLKQQQETENLRLENLRLRAAGTFSVTGADPEGVEYADLISGTDEDSVNQSAQAIGRLVAAARERDELKQQLEGKNGTPVTGRPHANLRPGSLPQGNEPATTGAGGISEAERRFGKKD